jgi:hypothetical protein
MPDHPAATAAQRLGLAPTFAHLDSTSFHVDGHSHSAEEPDAQMIHIPGAPVEILVPP